MKDTRRTGRGTNPNSLAALRPFNKGQSGNPLGPMVSPSYREVTQRAREHTPDAIKRLYEIMMDKRTKPRDAILAASVLLERGLGKTPHFVKLEVDERKAPPIDTTSVTTTDIERAAEIARILIDAGALESVVGEDGKRKLRPTDPNDAAVDVESALLRDKSKDN